MDPALPDEPVRLPRLAVVGEVAALERLLVHPEVAVVVLDHESARRRAGDDGAAPRAHEHRRAHGRTTRVLEHDVGIAADELPDPLAEPSPLGRVLGLLVLPELEALGLAVDHVLDAQCVEQLGPLGARHDADRRAAAVEHVLARVRADPAAGAPDEDGLALCHLRAVRAHEHAVAGRVGQRVDRRLLPGEVRRLRHQLVGLHQGELAEPAVVGLVAPDALVGGEHRVVVRARVLVVDVVAVHGDRVAGLARPAPPSRPAARRRRRRCRRRGTAGRAGRPRRSRARVAAGSRRWAAARRSTSRRC